MSTLLVLLILMGALLQALADGSYKSLGTGVDIAKVKIGAQSVLPKGYNIFKSNHLKCLEDIEDTGKSDSSHEFYTDTQDMVTKVGLSAGLSASFLSLVSVGASLRGTFGKTTKTTSSMSGYKHAFYMHTNKKYLDVNCVKELELNEKFENDFKALESIIRWPQFRRSWGLYDQFMKNYGTHYVSEITYGSSVTQYLSAKSSSKYTERDFSIKASLDVTVPVKVGLVKGGPSIGYSRKKSSSRHYEDIEDHFIAIGGKHETRNKIVNTHSLKYIERLMNEGLKHRAPVAYKFVSITDLLMTRFTRSRYENQVANLKAYIEGFLNFGCNYKRERNIELQKFEFQPRISEFPHYVCTLAPEGCRKDSDCKFKGKCRCRGDTCVRHDQPFPMRRTIAKMNDSKERGKIDKNCRLSWLSCKCKRRDSEQRKTVWPPSKWKTQTALAKIMTQLSTRWSALHQ